MLRLLLLCLLLHCAQGSNEKKAGCGQPCRDSTECSENVYCSVCVNPLTNSTFTPTAKKYVYGYCVRGLAVGENCTQVGANFKCFPWTQNDKVECVAKKVGKETVPLCTTTKSSQKAALGYIGAAIAIFLFGTNFLPVKKFETGDGLFFQWIVACAIWVSGFILYMVRGNPPFYPYAMLGGALWCTGNVTVVPIIKCIGLGLGLCVWGSMNMLVGWASGAFGFFGVTKEVPKSWAMNIVGVCLALCATVCFIFVKPTTKDDDDEDDYNRKYDTGVNENTGLLSGKQVGWEEKLSPTTKRILGISLSLAAGIFYGVNFDPPTYLQNNAFDKGLHSHVHYGINSLDYVFSHFTGIWLTSTFYFMCYCIYKRNNPDIYPKVILPAMASGFMWAAADIGWFIANENLSLVVAFPIVCLGPGLVGSAWGVFLLGEIRGLKNYLFLGGAFIITAAAATLISLSKK